ncbi:hypothetical protein D3C87_1796610 [compost metagenome]
MRFLRDRSLDLEQICAGKRTDPNLQTHVAAPGEAVSDLTGKPGKIDVGNDSTRIKRAPGKTDPKRSSHEALAAVSADQPACPNDFFALIMRNKGSNSVLILLEPLQLQTEFNPATKFGQARA